MIFIALLSFGIGVACAFRANILAFCLVALCMVALAALAALVIEIGIGAGWAALTAAIGAQVGYVVGTLVRGFILPFSVGRANERGMSEMASSISSMRK